MIYDKKFSDNDIAEEMEKGLIKSASHEEAQLENQAYVLRSLDAIAALAEAFEDKGQVREATLLTELLEAYAEGDSEKLKQNLLQTSALLSPTDEPSETEDDLVIHPEDASKVQEMMTFDDEA